MNKIILLLSIITLSTILLSTSSTYAEHGLDELDINDDTTNQINHGHGHFHSLKDVLTDREFGDPLVCPNPSHTLVLRPNSNWACVYPETAKHLDWDVVLYSIPDAPLITKSIFYADEYHHITHQTNEAVVDSVKLYSNTDFGNDGYTLQFSITPIQKGDLTITLPSMDSKMFENYCADFNQIPDSHFYFLLLDGVELEYQDIHTDNNITTIKLPYESNSELVEIIVACLI